LIILYLDNPQQLTVIPTNNLPQFLQNNNGVTIRGNNVVQVQFLITIKKKTIYYSSAA